MKILNFIELPKGSEKQMRALIKCARKMGKQQALKRKAELKSLIKKQSIHVPNPSQH